MILRSTSGQPARGSGKSGTSSVPVLGRETDEGDLPNLAAYPVIPVHAVHRLLRPALFKAAHVIHFRAGGGHVPNR